MKTKITPNLASGEIPPTSKDKGAVVVSLVAAKRVLGTTTWLRKLIKYVKGMRSKMRMLVIEIFPQPDEVELCKRSIEEQKALTLSLLGMLFRLEDGINSLPDGALEEVTENYNGIQILSLGMDIQSTAIGLIQYLPVIIPKIKKQYDVILIDIPNLFYPYMSRVAALSDYWLIPYLVADEKAIDDIFSINQPFKRLCMEERPFDLGGIIPIFAGREPSVYKRDLEKLNWIFNADKIWPFIADRNYHKAHKKVLDKRGKYVKYGYKATFDEFIKLVNSELYCPNPEILARRKKLLLFLDEFGGKFPKQDDVEQIIHTNLPSKKKLIAILESMQELSKKQHRAALSITTDVADRLIGKLQMEINRLSCEKILEVLDMGDLSKRNEILDKLVDFTILPRETIGLLLGESDRIIRYDVEAISLVKDHSFSECVEKLKE